MAYFGSGLEVIQSMNNLLKHNINLEKNISSDTHKAEQSAEQVRFSCEVAVFTADDIGLEVSLKGNKPLYLHSLNKIPLDLIIPSKITVTDKTMEQLIDIIDNPSTPTESLLHLMRHA